MSRSLAGSTLATHTVTIVLKTGTAIHVQHHLSQCFNQSQLNWDELFPIDCILWASASNADRQGRYWWWGRGSCYKLKGENNIHNSAFVGPFGKVQVSEDQIVVLGPKVVRQDLSVGHCRVCMKRC